MARASTVTMLSLDRFAAQLGISPLHINGFLHSSCGEPIQQYAWQHPGRIGREELAFAVSHAESLISDALGFYPLPIWTQEAHSVTPRMKAPLVSLAKGMVVEPGKAAKTLILVNRPVVFSDVDGDGVDELATITCVTTVTDPDEIAIYPPGKAGDDSWEVRPRTVVIAGGTATITCGAWQLADPDLHEALEPEDGLDPDDTNNYLALVDVYRKYTDISVQAQFEGYSWPCRSCGSSGCAACVGQTQAGCVKIIEGTLGYVAVAPATWDGTDLEFTSADWACGMGSVRTIRTWVRSGYRDSQSYSLLRMTPRLERAIAILAMALIGEEDLCTCLTTLQRRWAEDLAFQKSSTEEGTSYKLSNAVLNSPFGTTRGGIEAWRLVREVKNAISAG